MEEKTAPVQIQYTEGEIKEGKFFAMISYIAFLCVVTLLLKKDNKFALYHAKQGLVIFVFEVIAFVLTALPFVGFFIQLIGMGLSLSLSLWGIFYAFAGKCKPLPLVAKLSSKITL